MIAFLNKSRGYVWKSDEIKGPKIAKFEVYQTRIPEVPDGYEYGMDF